MYLLSKISLLGLVLKAYKTVITGFFPTELRSSLDSIHQTDILLSQDISLFLYEISWWNVHKSQSVFNF